MGCALLQADFQSPDRLNNNGEVSYPLNNLLYSGKLLLI